MATPTVDRLRSAIRTLNVKNNDLLSDCDNTFLNAKLVAEDLEKDHDQASVQELLDATLQLVTCSHTLHNHRVALDALATSYQPSAEVRDRSNPSSPLISDP